MSQEGVLHLNDIVHSSAFAQGMIVLEHIVIFVVILCEDPHE